MAAESGRASWSDLEPMDVVRRPSVLTKADVPRLADRVKQVATGRWQDRSGLENTVYFAFLVLLSMAGSLIWRSSSGVALRLIELVVALVVVGGVGTAVLVKLHFKN